MAWNFTFQVEGVPQMVRTFNRVEEKINDLRDVWDEIVPVIRRITDTQFKSKGARGASGAWAPLTAAYAKQKAVKYPGKPILQASGRMYAALTSDTGDTAIVKSKDEFGFGTSLIYPSYHQTGTSKMAKRPIIDLDESAKRDIQKAIQKGLLNTMKRDPSIISNLDVTN